MRFSFTHAAVTALTVSVVHSQSIAKLVALIPSCAVTCLASAATSHECGISDYSCVCGSASGDIIAAAAVCLKSSSCNVDDATLATSLSEQICDVVACSSASIVTASPVPGTVTASPIPSVTSLVPVTFTTAIPASTQASPTSLYPNATTNAQASSTKTAPATVSSNAGSKLNVGAVVVGAVVLAALGL